MGSLLLFSIYVILIARYLCFTLVPQKISLLYTNNVDFMLFAWGIDSMDKISMGRKIREARLKKGYTQQTLSEKANIGEMYLSEIERGIKMPSMNLFIKLITALDVSADYVLRDEVPSGKEFVYNEITQKMEGLTPKQRKAAADILDAYIRNL